MEHNLAKFDSMSVPRAVLSNAIPAMLTMLMALIYNMADLFFIGQAGDPLLVAAVSLAAPIFIIFLSIGNVFGVGGASLLSRNLGKGDYSMVKKISSFCFWCSLVIGIILPAIVLIWMDEVVTILGSSANISAMVETYLYILCFGAPFILISNAFSALVRGEGKAKHSMIGMILGNLINIILDPIFILQMDMGVAGAAIATVIGSVCSGIYYIVLVLQKGSTLSINIKDFTPKDGILKSIVCIGIPASLSTLLMSSSQIIINGQMAAYGDLAVAGIGVAVKVTMITSMVCVGVGIGVQPLLGFSIGAQNKKRYDAVFKFGLLFALGLGVVLTVLCYLGMSQIVGAFLTEEEAFQYGYVFSQILISTSFLFGILCVLTNALQSAGAATGSLVVNLSRQGIVYIPLIFILGSTVGIYGLVLAQPIADIISVILAIVLYRMAYKKMFVGASQSTAKVV